MSGMILRLSAGRPLALARFPGELIVTAACGAAAILCAVSVAKLGMYSLLVPAYLGALAFAVLSPTRAALGGLIVGIAFEPDAIDISKPVSAAIYQMPPGFEHALPLTMTPLELLICVICASLLLRPRPATGLATLPAVVWAFPVVVILSFGYGALRGGDVKIGYEEARGLLYGAAVFIIARRMTAEGVRGLTGSAMIGTVGLAAIVMIRYFFITRDGGGGVSPDFAYAHEDAIFLSAGFVLGGALLLRESSLGARLTLLLYEVFVLSALLTTGRRAGTLAIVVGVLALAWFTFRRRPKVIIGLGIPALLLGGAYLGAYWNKEYGALAQPARAIRSQIDPNARDQSSDVYRSIEKANVEETIRLNRLSGVGLGRPFAQFQGMPSLTSFWPLQFYTPHANLLWLWLKFGLFGFAAVLAIWVIALQRCIASLRRGLNDVVLPVGPTVCACVLLMYISYAQVDLALIGSRSTSLLAVAIAVALSFHVPATSSPP